MRGDVVNQSNEVSSNMKYFSARIKVLSKFFYCFFELEFHGNLKEINKVKMYNAFYIIHGERRLTRAGD
jgi:hypothetical protein